jgi:hypothetical protein
LANVALFLNCSLKLSCEIAGMDSQEGVLVCVKKKKKKKKITKENNGRVGFNFEWFCSEIMLKYPTACINSKLAPLTLA